MDNVFETLSATLAILLAAAGAFLASSDWIRRLLRREEPQKLYSERLAELTENLSKASREVDSVLAELAQVAKDRAQAVQQLEADLANMSGRETELKKRIDDLEKTPLAVAEHFARLVAPGEKRNAMRDYVLFGAGVVVSTATGIAIQVFLR